MKTMVSLAIVALCFCSISAFGQASSVYDTRYAGPVNVYGQPAYTVPPQSAQPRQNQQPLGVLPVATGGLQQLGNFLWGYLPAPVTGQQSPYYVPPGSGQVNTVFVPGTR